MLLYTLLLLIYIVFIIIILFIFTKIYSSDKKPNCFIFILGRNTKIIISILLINFFYKINYLLSKIKNNLLSVEEKKKHLGYLSSFLKFTIEKKFFEEEIKSVYNLLKILNNYKKKRIN